MRKFSVLLLAALLLQIASVSARPTHPPRSLAGGVGLSAEVDHRRLDPVDVAARMKEDESRSGRAPFRVAVPVSMTADLKTAGTWETLADGGKLWRLRVSAEGARFLSVKFSELFLPPGAELHFISVDREYYDGPYTHRHTSTNKRFGSPAIPGESAIIELFLPLDSATAKLVVESVSYGYRNAFGMDSIPNRGERWNEGTAAATLGDNFACQRDINCVEGAAYQDDKRAVAEGYDGSFVCSGTMINNVRQDCRYLYVTAEHCEWWVDPPSMVFYWNYENSGCGTNDAPFSFSTGSSDLYHDAAADIQLLELSGTDLEDVYDIYFSGWDRGPSAPSSSATIGFPNDKPKQIAIDTDSAIDCAPSGCSNGFGANFWRIEDWEVGVTEVGSSGSGLLNPDHRLVGVLSGGVGTHCNNFGWDEYAKLSAQWPALATYLDPDGTGAVSIAGRDNLVCGVSPPPPLADGIAGNPMTLTKGPGNSIAVSYDNATCSSDHTVMLWGSLGNWTGYQSDVGAGCDLGSTGLDSFSFASDNVWFNLVWVGADGAAGSPGSSSAGERAWSANGMCGVTGEDTSDPVCN